MNKHILVTTAAFFSLNAIPTFGAPASGSLEAQVYDALNAFRANPSSLVPVLQGIRARLQGNELPIAPGVTYETLEGAVAIDSAIEAIQNAPALPSLQYSDALEHAAQDAVKDQVQTGATGHVGSDQSTPLTRMERYANIEGVAGENVQYGYYAGGQTGQDMILAWIVDDGVKPRPHRQNLMNADFAWVGIACGQHPQWGEMCTMDLAAKATPKSR